MLKTQTAAGLSSQATLKIAGAVRSKFGRKGVEPGLKEFLENTNHKLEGFYSCQMTTFEKKVQKTKSSVERPKVFCSDIPGLINCLLEERE